MSGGSQRLVFAGHGRWSRMLSKGLYAHAGVTSTVAPFDSLRDSVSVESWRRLAAADTVVRVGFRPGSPAVRGRAFDAAFSAAMRLGRPTKTVYYWIGSDVRQAMDDVAAGRDVERFRRLTSQALNLAGSKPLADDLATIGINADLADFPLEGLRIVGDPPDLPKDFTVLTYIPDARSVFYGGPQLLLAARRLPGVHFLVMGGKGRWAENPPANVTFLGWVEDSYGPLSHSSCVMRMVEYDSIGGTVMEGLVMGRAVVYSRQMEYVTHVPFGDTDALVAALSGIAERARRGELGLDLDAVMWARSFFDPHARFLHLAAILSALPDGGSA